MVKTQVQVPDELYEKAKALAKAKEWSLAEVFRRGLEYMTRTNAVEEVEEHWVLPKLGGERFRAGSDELDLKGVAQEEEVRGFGDVGD
ncbi:MAG: hypothetical protein AAGC74_04400 [Verrucomicrobiota bacterium]